MTAVRKRGPQAQLLIVSSVFVVLLAIMIISPDNDVRSFLDAQALGLVFFGGLLLLIVNRSLFWPANFALVGAIETARHFTDRMLTSDSTKIVGLAVALVPLFYGTTLALAGSVWSLRRAAERPRL